jgi:hypothetical protein
LVATWAKVKFDRQIVAIAKVEKASMVYSDDEDVRKLAAAEGIPICVRSAFSVSDHRDTQSV